VLLERQVRAYAGWPGSHLETNLGRLVVRRASLPPPSAVPRPAGPGTGAGQPAQPGLIVSLGAGLALASAAGLLALDEVQLAGGRPMTGADLRRGHPRLIGSTAG
ncbi:MAG: hypothetical protein ACRDGQ_03030, partial [Candidatus Limnocylindrales bacterium]